MMYQTPVVWSKIYVDKNEKLVESDGLVSEL